MRREPHWNQAARSAILRWTRGIGDRNPLFLDEAYARRYGPGFPVAPPCWLYGVDNTFIVAKLPDLHAIYGGTEWEFYKWVRQGDDIRVRARLLGVEEKNGRFCGPMVLQTGEVNYFNGQNEPVARAVSQVFRTNRQEAVNRGKYLNWNKYPYPADELQKVEDGYDNEEIRGSAPRYYEDVAVGEALTPVVRGPLTSEDILQFVGSTSPVKGFARFVEYHQRHPSSAFTDPETGMVDSWEASVIDDKVARIFGFPFAHDCGIDRISWVGNLLTNWMSDQGFMKNLRVKLLLPNIYGDVTWCRGKVTDKRQEGGESLVDLEVWCESQRGTVTAEGNATLSLPSHQVDVF
jgi:acyl dehydratase